MHTCDHQTSSLGTKADHERRFALEEAIFRSKHPLFRREKGFPLTTARYLGKVCRAQRLLLRCGDVSEKQRGIELPESACQAPLFSTRPLARFQPQSRVLH
jgi:hypothetical protein